MISLEKKSSISLTKQVPGLNNVRAGLSWDSLTINGKEADADVSVFMLNENSKNSNKPIIKTRILLINKLKNAFYKSIPDETFRNNKILKDILITRASKRKELLIFAAEF